MYVSTITSAHYFSSLFFILMFLSKNVTALVDERKLIEIARIRAIQEAICGFLLDEVINHKGEFHGDLRTSVAKEDPTTRKLIRYYS